jgi:PhzF family phenazine biosynthesis protein
MQVPLFLVDAFADQPFSGNPAGVCLLDKAAEERWMQNLAMEMNQAETAFLYPENGAFKLRWFTPTSEVDLCGHATLASAHVLWESGRLPRGEAAVFETKSGFLTCTSSDEMIEMDFPAVPAESVNVHESLLEMIGAHPVWFGRNSMDYLVELLNEDDVYELELDLARLAEIETRGFIFTARCTSGKADFVSRFFAPAFGVPEDSVTGSAHCCLAPYWSEKLGKAELLGYQASRRGGFVGVRVAGDRVKLRGRAMTVVRGEVCVPSS